MTTRLQSAYKGIETGHDWELKGDLSRALGCYQSVLSDFIFLSLIDSATVKDVADWLTAHPFDTAAERYFSACRSLLSNGPAQRINSFRNDHYNLFAFAHFFAALGQHGRADFLMENAFQSTGRSTPFWSEYLKAMRAMMRRETFAPQFKKLKGLEGHWRLYVELMGAVTLGSNREAVLSEIDNSFAARNRDLRLNGIGEFDGSGHFPLRFDFRKAGLLATIDHEGL